ncbi:FAD-binding protein [Streptomyces rectiverticillatus]|uniref:FAD-dependent monooxygenase n=1 Tax=Streptomyces rectiverticillatus TaxID=173860 RepID=UPI0015C38E22|nr:FAD-dependent monooxygenase [Streptomyces rectiverticillatus]QLE73520.1 FAD-binding protein [Streptomyces rectiverticillatus]
MSSPLFPRTASTPPSASAPADVIVVGAGPTGLLLAGDLAAAGVRVTVVEKRARESNLTRAFAVHARTLEAFDARGIAEPLLSTGPFLDTLRIFGRGRIDLSRLPSRFPGVLMTPQYETERVLEERALKAGAVLQRGAEVLGLRQDADGVELDVRTEGDGAENATGTLRAAYVVGADGVRSAVRKALGMPFPGRSVLRSVMLADVRLETVPDGLPAFNSGRDGFAFLVPFGDGYYRAIAWRRGCELPSGAPVELDELKAVTRAAFGTDYGMHDARWTSRFHSDERQVPRYREGRVLLAGDAAHVHSPAGGLGMNAGLQDAANLGWKLAAVLKGTAPDSLLDSYHDERHPVGRLVLRLSGTLLRSVLLASPVARGLRDAAALAAGALPFATDRGALMMSGIGIDYPAPPGSHPLTGRRAPDLPLAERPGEPSRLYEALRAGTYVRVLPRGGGAPPHAPHDKAGVTTVTRADARPTTLLVRPDGYVAEAADHG